MHFKALKIKLIEDEIMIALSVALSNSKSLEKKGEDMDLHKTEEGPYTLQEGFEALKMHLEGRSDENHEKEFFH